MITLQHWFWQLEKKQGQDNIWVAQNTSLSCKTLLWLAQLLQPMSHPSYTEFRLHPNSTSAATVMCSQWQSQHYMKKWPAIVLVSHLGFLMRLSEASGWTVRGRFAEFFPDKAGKTKAYWLCRNPVNGVHVQTRAGDPWTFRKQNQIAYTAHCHAGCCHPPWPVVM